MRTLTYILREMMVGALSMLLVVSILLGTFGPGVFTQKAEALDGGGSLALVTKEYVLDGIAFALINMILQLMSQSIISWINSGFKGSPTFIQDFGGFMTGIADRVAGDYIWGSDLNFLCSPFQLDIRLALDIQYKQTRNFAIQNQCTLSGVVGNMQNFMNGNFLSGGWNGWFTMTQSAANNPYGSILMASEQFSVRLGNSKFQAKTELDFGKGFLSMKQCRDDGTGSGGEQCDIVTPGTAIEAQLNASLDSGRQRIQVADEINEIIAALFSQLVSQAFSGIGGLLGLTGGGSGGTGGSPYYNSLYQQQPGGVVSPSQNPIQISITSETNYRNLEQTLAGNIQSAALYKDTTYGAANTCHPGTLTTELQNQLTTSQNTISISNATIATLNSLLTQYNAAVVQRDTRTQQAIMQQYTDLQVSGAIHSSTDTTRLRDTTIPDTQRSIDTFIADIDTACP